MKTKISSDNKRCVSMDIDMLLPEEYPPPLGVDILVLTQYDRLIIGKWDGSYKQWFPLPNKKK